jgi:hypothetical protein
MPKQVEHCVTALMKSGDFNPKMEHDKRKSAAYAVCWGQYQKTRREYVERVKKNRDVIKMTDQQLLFDNAIFVAWENKLKAGGTISGWSQEEILTSHQEIISELRKRGYKPADAPTHLSSLSQSLGMTDFPIRIPFISIAGSFEGAEQQKKGPDILVYSPDVPLLEKDVLSFTVGALFERIGNFTIHFLPDNHTGPFTKFVPLYSLVCRLVGSDAPLASPSTPSLPDTETKSLRQIVATLGDGDIMLSVNALWFDFVRDTPIVDVYSSIQIPEDLQASIEEQVSSLVPAEYRDLFQFHFDDTIPESASPMYDIVLRRINTMDLDVQRGMEAFWSRMAYPKYTTPLLPEKPIQSFNVLSKTFQKENVLSKEDGAALKRD